MTMQLFNRLEAEWVRIGRDAKARAAIRRWRADDSELEGYLDLAGLVGFCQQLGHPEESDGVLRCLAARAAGDDLAARALLQAVLHGLITIAATFRSVAGSEEDAAAVVVTAAFSRIRTYPIDRRPNQIAANILLDTRQAVSRSLFRRRVLEVLDPEPPSHAPAETSFASRELLCLVEGAVVAHRVSLDDARLVLLTRVVGISIAEIADEVGCLPQSLRRRRLRAEGAMSACA